MSIKIGKCYYFSTTEIRIKMSKKEKLLTSIFFPQYLSRFTQKTKSHFKISKNFLCVFLFLPLESEAAKRKLCRF